MTTSIAEAILEGSHRLRKAGVPEARREAGSLLSHVLEQDRAFLLTHADDPIAEPAIALFRKHLERRAAGEPLQYITGHQEFFGLDFEVTPDVLIPRPETELLVEVAKKLTHESSAPFFCDVGTGSGCIAVTLLHELPSSRALALDISPKALQVAQRNAERHLVTDRVDFVLSDGFSALSSKNPRQSSFDLIVSNPPYVEEGAIPDLQTEVRDFEPRQALVAGVDGLAVVRQLLLKAGSFLKSQGFLVFEIGFNQSAAVKDLINPKIWTLLDLHKDLQGIPRTVALQKHS